jgi:hypothetical protein
MYKMRFHHQPLAWETLKRRKRSGHPVLQLAVMKKKRRKMNAESVVAPLRMGK